MKFGQIYGWARAKTPCGKMCLVYFPERGRSNLVRLDKLEIVDHFTGAETFEGVITLSKETEYLPTGQKLAMKVDSFGEHHPLHLTWTGTAHRITHPVF